MAECRPGFNSPLEQQLFLLLSSTLGRFVDFKNQLQKPLRARKYQLKKLLLGYTFTFIDLKQKYVIHRERYETEKLWLTLKNTLHCIHIRNTELKNGNSTMSMFINAVLETDLSFMKFQYFRLLPKGGLISEGILTLVPLPTKSGLSPVFGNGTKVKIPSEISPPLTMTTDCLLWVTFLTK